MSFERRRTEKSKWPQGSPFVRVFMNFPLIGLLCCPQFILLTKIWAFLLISGERAIKGKIKADWKRLFSFLETKKTKRILPFDSCCPLLLTIGLQCLLNKISGNLSPSIFVMLFLESRLTSFFPLRTLFWRMRPVAHGFDRNWITLSELIMITFKDFTCENL